MLQLFSANENIESYEMLRSAEKAMHSFGVVGPASNKLVFHISHELLWTTIGPARDIGVPYEEVKLHFAMIHTLLSVIEIELTALHAEVLLLANSVPDMIQALESFTTI